MLRVLVGAADGKSVGEVVGCKVVKTFGDVEGVKDKAKK